MFHLQAQNKWNYQEMSHNSHDFFSKLPVDSMYFLHQAADTW